MAEQEVQLMKPRITLKSIFRTTPESRKEYVQGVSRYNKELLEQARLKKLALAEQKALLDKYNKEMEAYNKASKRNTNVFYTSKVAYTEPAPAPTKSSSGGSSSRSSSTGSRTTYTYTGTSKVVSGRSLPVVTKSSSTLGSLKVSPFVSKSVKKISFFKWGN